MPPNSQHSISRIEEDGLLGLMLVLSVIPLLVALLGLLPPLPVQVILLHTPVV